MTAPADPTPAYRARNLLVHDAALEKATSVRAAAWATLAIADALDRQTATLGRIADALELRRAP